MTDKEKRSKLLNQYKEMKKEWRKKQQEIFDNDELDDDAFEEALSKAEKAYKSKSQPIWWEAFALQFPKRRGWFAEVFAESFGICENRRITEKQTDVFKQYCVQDAESWRSGMTYCRFSDKLIILHCPKYARGFGFITIKQI